MLAKHEQFAPRNIYLTQKMQLIAEAYLINKILGYSVPHGHIKFLKSNKYVKADINNNFQDFLESLEGIKEVLRNESMPEPTEYKNRCKDFCFSKICRRT
jgi:CRISPR/Cas system-associated exonuclease Cas4 (RecB family)